MKYPDFRKAPEGATHWDTQYGGFWCNEEGFWYQESGYYTTSKNTDWGTDRYIRIPVVDWSKAPEGLDYAYTTGPEWSGNSDLLGSVEFANQLGVAEKSNGNHKYLSLGVSAWVLLETRPEAKVKEESPTLVKDYKILEVFVDKETNPLRYRGYWGSLHISLSDNLIHGSIAQIKDLVTYEADTIVGIKEAFIDAVDDYILTREEIDNGSY